MDNELEELWKDTTVAYFKVLLEGLRKTVKNLSQDSQSPGYNLNPALPVYEAGGLTIG
jgi:hypothetical protein